MSSHLNRRYWARLSVTSDFSDSLAGLCYELIRWGIIFADYAGSWPFHININKQKIMCLRGKTAQKIGRFFELLFAMLLLFFVVANVRRIPSVVSLIESLFEVCRLRR